MFSNGHFNCTKRQNKEFNHQSKEGCQAQAEGQNQLEPLSALALQSQWVHQVLNIECGRRVSQKIPGLSSKTLPSCPSVQLLEVKESVLQS